jgi:dTDP-4-amino-4,6-dideoxygalactose transaminase
MEQERFISNMKRREISTPFHYVPLHSAPAGREFGRSGTPMPVTDSIWCRLVRLPLYPSMRADMVGRVIEAVGEVTGRLVLS